MTLEIDILMEPTFKLTQLDDRAKAYEEFLPMLYAFVSGEDDFISLLANTSAAIHDAFGFFWVGFYLVSEKDELLHIGPFQGGAACSRIKKGRGVCGTAWQQESTVIVPNVDEFPGHIACSSASRSEIVVPMFKKGKVVGVLDIDSDQLNEFSQTDKKYLEDIVNHLCNIDC